MAKKAPRYELFKTCVADAKKRAGGDYGFNLIGPNLRRALVAERILMLQQQFRRQFDGAVVVDTIGELCDLLADEFPAEDI